MLSKKYYKILADLIGKAEDLQDFQKNLIEFLTQDNPRFDKTRFINAMVETKLTKLKQKQDQTITEMFK